MAANSKRHFLKTLVAANGLSFLSAPAINAAGLSGSGETSHWKTLQAQQLESLIGQHFSVYASGTSHVMSLAAVSTLEDPNRPTEFVRKNSFTARFIPVGSGSHQTDQLARITHPGIGGAGLVFAMAKNNEEGDDHLEIVFS